MPDRREQLNDSFILTPRELFTHELGDCYRTEWDVCDGERGWWEIEDLDGNHICTVASDLDGRWRSVNPLAGPFRPKHQSFLESLNAHVLAIQKTDGIQSDDLFWEGTCLPRWN